MAAHWCAMTVLTNNLNSILGISTLHAGMSFDEIEEVVVHVLSQMIEDQIGDVDEILLQLRVLRTVLYYTNMFTGADLDRAINIIDKLIAKLSCISDKANCVPSDDAVTKEPTCTEDGFASGVCILCGKRRYKRAGL